MKYTAEYMNGLSDNELTNLAKDIAAGKLECTKEEKQTIYDQMMVQIEYQKDLIEVLQTAKACIYAIYPEQYEALKEAYKASDQGDWICCGSALEVFFDSLAIEDLTGWDVSGWNYNHIIRWYDMTNQTNLCEAQEGSSAWLFSKKISAQFFLKMPPSLIGKMREGLKNLFPEAHSLPEDSTIYSEDGQKCVTMAEAAKTIGMSENELTDALTEMGFGEYVIPEDQTHTMQ